MIYVFVEGKTDDIFISKLFNEKLLIDNYLVVQYSTKKSKEIKNYINTIKQIDNSEYIFLADQDGNVDKKNVIMSKYPFLDKDKVFISIYEIESWIISGLSIKLSQKYKIRQINLNTSKITKEIFDNLVPSSMSKLEFILYVLDDFDILQAIKYNESFKIFYEYIKKRAS